MRKSDEPASAPVRTRADNCPDGVTIVQHEYYEAPDELIECAKSGLEEKTWRALVRSGELQARRLGRSWWTTRSALCALIARAPKAIAERGPVADTDSAYAELVRQAGARR